MTRPFTESVVEGAALAWLKATGWRVAHGPDIAPDMPAAARRDYGDVVLAQRLRDALARLNPALPAEALEDAYRKLTRPDLPTGQAGGADLIQRNRALHRLLVNGVTVEYRTPGGEVRGAQARVIDFDEPAGNDWLAVNQFGVVENKHSRRTDVVLFVNGLPLAVIELKNAADEDATISSAFQQLQTYQAEIPSLFATNGVLVVSDGVEARELRARKILGAHQQTVLDDIERRKKYAAYGLCIDDTKTLAITAKSTAVTKSVGSQKLKRSFQEELINLSFRHVEVELKEIGDADGVFYHKGVLTRAPGVELLKVVSEGEQRCLSIAAFFAET